MNNVFDMMLGLLTFLNAIDPCITQVDLRDDGFIQVTNVHHPHLIEKSLRSEGYHRIAIIPCSCVEQKRLSARRHHSKAARNARFMHLKSRDHQGPRPPKKPPSSMSDL